MKKMNMYEAPKAEVIEMQTVVLTTSTQQSSGDVPSQDSGDSGE